MVAAMIVPFQVIMTPLISIYGSFLGILDHRLTLVFMHVGFSISMAVFIYHGFIKSNIPLSLEEAATLDGCSRTQTFFRIVFPLLKPITATIIVLNVLAIWNDYLLPSLVLTKKELFTLPLSDQLRRGDGRPDADGSAGYHSVPVPAKADHQRRDFGRGQGIIRLRSLESPVIMAV